MVDEPFDQNTTEERLVVRGARVIVTVHGSSCSVLTQGRLEVLDSLARCLVPIGVAVLAHAVFLSRREDPHRCDGGLSRAVLTARGQ